MAQQSKALLSPTSVGKFNGLGSNNCCNWLNASWRSQRCTPHVSRSPSLFSKTSVKYLPSYCPPWCLCSKAASQVSATVTSLWLPLSILQTTPHIILLEHRKAHALFFLGSATSLREWAFWWIQKYTLLTAFIYFPSAVHITFKLLYSCAILISGIFL